MTAIVTKGKGLWSIARENHVKVSDLYKANPGLESMQKKGTIPKNHKIEIPTKSKGSSPKLKPKPKSASKKTIKKSTKKKTSKKVSKESKNTKKCKCESPSWMVIAKQEMNKKVQRNRNQGKKGNNSIIIDYHKTTSILSWDKRGERVPWCGTYINYVMKKSGYKTISGAYGAKSWAKYGQKISTPIYGAIGVKSRKGGGHVAFVMGVDNISSPKYVYMLGGNQWGYSNNISWGTKTKKKGKSYVKSVLFPSQYKLSDWDFGFFVPKSYCTKNCTLQKYTGKYIISEGDGN